MYDRLYYKQIHDTFGKVFNASLCKLITPDGLQKLGVLQVYCKELQRIAKELAVEKLQAFQHTLCIAKTWSIQSRYACSNTSSHPASLGELKSARGRDDIVQSCGIFFYRSGALACTDFFYANPDPGTLGHW